MPQPQVTSAKELEALVQHMGFLPLFACSIPHFSVEEFTPQPLLVRGGLRRPPWEWRMEAAKRDIIAYA